MNPRAIARYAAAYLLTAALGIAAGGALAHPHNAPPAVSVRGETSLGTVVLAGNSKPVKEDPPHNFTMTGAVTGLVPGRAVTLPITITNPNQQSIKILTIGVTAGDASKTCPAAGNLTVSSYDSAARGAPVYVVPGRSTGTVPLTIRLVNATNRNQNACKKVTFPLSYVGTGMQWGD